LLTGDIAELRIYGSALSDAQLQAVRKELRKRYLTPPQGTVCVFR
jgi:hypothetical protein